MENIWLDGVMGVIVGDDTVGAIACGLAGLYYSYEGISAEWRNVIQKKEESEEACKGDF